MSQCAFEKLNSKVVQCRQCGRRMHAVPGLAIERYNATCRTASGPSLHRKVINYTKAVARDLIAGRPRRTTEEVEAILVICRSNRCGLYDATGGVCTHKRCGCKVERKAPYGMERCPVGLW
jgi:hypothetical protein